MAMLAVRRFELNHGKLPTSLEEVVVAGFIPEDGEAMQDPFGGGPLQYHSASGRIYSVGANLQDDGGGSIHESAKRHLDVGDDYWWSVTLAPDAGS